MIEIWKYPRQEACQEFERERERGKESYSRSNGATKDLPILGYGNLTAKKPNKEIGISSEKVIIDIFVFLFFSKWEVWAYLLVFIKLSLCNVEHLLLKTVGDCMYATVQKNAKKRCTKEGNPRNQLTKTKKKTKSEYTSDINSDLREIWKLR